MPIVTEAGNVYYQEPTNHVPKNILDHCKGLEHRLRGLGPYLMSTAGHKLQHIIRSLQLFQLQQDSN